MSVELPDDEAVWGRWLEAVARPEIDAGILALHAAMDDAVAARGPTCWQSGKCCHFDAYGHRLYVTGLEAAWFVQRRGTAPPPADAPTGHAVLPILERPPAAAHPGCPFQVDHRCTVHADRPLGCRVFFCQAGTEAWQADLYDRYHAAMRRLHDAHGVPYRYLEWRAALDQAAQASASAA